MDRAHFCFFGTILAGKIRGIFVLLRWQFWVTTVLSLLVALLAGYDVVLVGQNRATQAGLTQRLQYVQQSVQLEGLYRELVKALADLSVRNKDQALADLLSRQGITFNTGAPGASPAPTAAGPRNGARP